MSENRSGCCPPARLRRCIQTSSPRLCLSSPRMHTCEFLIHVHPRDTGSARYCVVTPGRRVHLCIELGRCISPEIASTRTDPRRGTRCHEIDKMRSSKSDEHTRDEHRMRLKTITNVYVHRPRIQWLIYESEIILVLHLNARARTCTFISYVRHNFDCIIIWVLLAIISHYYIIIVVPQLSHRCMLSIIYPITDSVYVTKLN